MHEINNNFIVFFGLKNKDLYLNFKSYTFTTFTMKNNQMRIFQSFVFFLSDCKSDMIRLLWDQGSRF